MEGDEQWKVVEGWAAYEVSNLGRVRRAENQRIRKPIKISGYQAVTLTQDGRRQIKLVHRLVAFAFLPQRIAKNMQVNHRDSDRWNPRADNLEWVTPSANIKHGFDHGNCNAKGESNGYSKLNEACVFEIRNSNRIEYPALAALYNVSLATVRDVAARRTWKHV